MNRIKLSLPEPFYFSTRLPVRITDVNYGGHVGNDAFLSIIHEARMRFLQHHGYAELEFAGIGLIMVDVAIEYKAELNYGDEVEIFVSATDFDKLGFDLYYRMEIVKPGGNVLAAKAKTGMMGYDYDLKKKVAVPEVAIKKLQG